MALDPQLDVVFMRRALRLAQRARGLTSPNPLVGAVIVKSGRVLGQGWHHRAGEPHAEIEALQDVVRKGHSPRGATLYVTLEPCCTHGRTPPCTDAILASGVGRVVAADMDPNPRHAGRGLDLLRRSGIQVTTGVLAEMAHQMNEAFNHWIVHHQPLVTVKAAMTLDGKIATATGESKWITGEPARAWAMNLRRDADAILVGINTILADDPRLLVRWDELPGQERRSRVASDGNKVLRRIVLDSRARTPLTSKVVTDAAASSTVIVTGYAAPPARVERLRRRVTVWQAPLRSGRIDLVWLLQRLGAENITHLLVEGGGQINASFLLERRAHRVVFFYAPMILGGRKARKAVEGTGVLRVQDTISLHHVRWRRLGTDLVMTAMLGR